MVLLPVHFAIKAQATAKESVDKADVQITAAIAASQAVEILGFEALKASDTSVLKNSAHLVAMGDTTTPFVNEELNRKEVWQVEFQDVALELKEPAGLDPEFRTRDFQMYMDAYTGIVLKVTSRAGNYDSTVIRKPSVQQAQESVESTSERFLGLPQQQPAVSFRDALKLVKGCPFRAMEIDAVYVIASHPWKAPEGRPVWSIHLYGVDLLFPSPRKDDEPIYQLNHMRTVVDAMTGELLYGTNSPQAK